jgi:hypothetical protein
MQHEALTAYGLLQFKDMARVHPVDPELIKRTQAFLLSRKDGKGGFQRNKKALDGFGGAPKHTTDAYIVWALVESDPDDKEKLDLKAELAALKAAALDENSRPGRTRTRWRWRRTPCSSAATARPRPGCSTG